MNEITLTIPGVPIAKKRPKFFRRGNFVGAYNAQETEEGRWLLMASQQVKQKIEGPVNLSFVFHMPIPSSVSKKKQSDLVSSPHIKKPDTDNCIKFCLDCLNGVLFADDRQVFALSAVKIYGLEPRTEITVNW